MCDGDLNCRGFRSPRWEILVTQMYLCPVQRFNTSLFRLVTNRNHPWMKCDVFSDLRGVSNSLELGRCNHNQLLQLQWKWPALPSMTTIIDSHSIPHILRGMSTNNMSSVSTLFKVVEIRVTATFINEPVHSAFNEAALKCIGLEVFDVMLIWKYAFPNRHVHSAHLWRTLGYHWGDFNRKCRLRLLRHVYTLARFWRRHRMMNHNLDRR